jgi:hypothetical protein
MRLRVAQRQLFDQGLRRPGLSYRYGVHPEHGSAAGRADLAPWPKKRSAQCWRYSRWRRLRQHR